MRPTIPILVLLFLVPFPVFAQAQNTPSAARTEAVGAHVGNSVFLIEAEIDRLNDRKEVLNRRKSHLEQSRLTLDSELNKLEKVKAEIERINQQYISINASFLKLKRAEPAPAPPAPATKAAPAPEAAPAAIDDNENPVPAPPVVSDNDSIMERIEIDARTLARDIFEQSDGLSKIDVRIGTLSESTVQILA